MLLEAGMERTLSPTHLLIAKLVYGSQSPDFWVKNRDRSVMQCTGLEQYCFSFMIPFTVFLMPHYVGIPLFFVVLIGLVASWFSDRSETRLLALGDPVAGRIESATPQGSGIVSVTCSWTTYQGKRYQNEGTIGQTARTAPGDLFNSSSSTLPSRIAMVIYMSCSARLKKIDKQRVH